MNPEIILGSPGCGKTEALLGLVEGELERGTKPEKIGFVSFTKRATEEAITRACQKFKMERRQFPHFRTLHSLCFHYLGMRRSDVLEGSRMQEFARYAGVKLTSRWSDDGTLAGFSSGDRAVFLENLSRVRMRSLEDEYRDDLNDGEGLKWSECQRIALALRQFKQERGLHDFTDMLQMFVAAAPRLGLEVLLGDEQQDSSKLQWQVFNQAAQGCRRVVVAADDDQAIYKWSGADVDTLIDLEGATTVLGQSYRVPLSVQNLAQEVIGRVSHRRPKSWAPRAAQGTIDRAIDFDDTDTDGADVLILARNSYVLNEQVEPALRRRGVFFERNGRFSIDPRLLSAVQDWERLRLGQALAPEAAKACTEHTTKVHWNVALDEYPEVRMSDIAPAGGQPTAIWYEVLDRIPNGQVEYIRAARAKGEKLRAKPRVRLSTIHSAKGAESEHVILLTEVAPRTARDTERFPEDEARVFYVGVTRARERLTLVGSQSPNRYRL